MQDLIQQCVWAQAFEPKSLSAKHTTDWMNGENHRYVTFVITHGASGGTTTFKIQSATSAAGSSAADCAAPFVGGVYYSNRAAATATTMVQYAVTSTSSVQYVPTTSASNAIYLATVDMTAATTDSKPYMAIVGANSSASTSVVACLAIFHGSRYGNETGADVLA